MRYYVAQVFLVFCWLLAAASAAPWPSSVPVCARECPITDSAKLRYLTDKTYVYRYSGKSSVEMKGIDGALSESHWEKKVLLSWLNPCEMAITFSDIKVEGKAPESEENTLLTRYPLVVSVIDGKVDRVCSHPSDEPWAINMKKGVASEFQNLLPTLTSVSSGVNFTETDVAGHCPTKYLVEKQSDKVIVTKEKDLRWCLDQFVTPLKNPKIFTKFPVPIERTLSMCKQEIINGIYSSITCKSKTVLRPSAGAYKHIEANQESALHFVSENQQAPESLSTIQGKYDYGSLIYDHRSLHKQTAFVSILEENLKKLCTMTRNSIGHESASMMSDIIQVMKRVPNKDIPQVLEKIRQGQICPQKKRLEKLFLHAIAFTYDSGSVKLIVDELLKGSSFIHTGMYALALSNTHHPDTDALRELKRLFESDKLPPYVLMNAGSMVNNFCSHLQECHRVPEVTEIMNVLNSKLQQRCVPSEEEHTVEAAQATLLSLGNMRVMTPEVSNSVLKCIETRGVAIRDRVAATRTFRNVKCQRHVTMNLIKIAVDPKIDDEVRIESYLAAMRCAEREDVEEITSKIVHDDNTQVRSFMLSHIKNIQSSKNPEKKHLKYLLRDFIIPSNYSRDFRRYSRNFDTSFYEPALRLGGGVETDLIYAPGSFVPRSVAFNFTSMLYGTNFRLAEVGTRFEGLDRIIKNIFGPPAIFKGGSSDSARKTEGDSLMEHIARAIHERRPFDVSSIGEMLKKIYGEGISHDPLIEFYVNVMGQDIAYEVIKGDLKDIDFGRFINDYMSKFKDMFASEMNIDEDNSHMTHVDMDYYLPTGHGTPLRMRFTGTAVLGMKTEGKLNLRDLFSSSSGSENTLKVIPGLSVEANGFIGYDCYLAKTGLQMNNLLSINNGITVSLKNTPRAGFEAHVDLPENMDLIQAQSETYLMKALRGSKEQVIVPESVRGNRIIKASCITEWESMLGFKLCYNMDVPDLFQNDGLPLNSKSTVKLHIEKTDPSLKGYKIKGAMHNAPGNKELTLNMETKGLATPKKTEAIISYTKHGDSFNVKTTVMAPNLQGGIWVTLHNEESQRNLEIYGEYKSNTRTLSQGFKMEFRTTSSDSGGSTNILLFASQSRAFPPESKIFSLQVISNRQPPYINMALHMNTHNALAKAIDLSFQVAFNLESSQRSIIPKLRSIRRIELELAAVGWKLVSYMRPGAESSGNSEISTAFNLSHRSNEVLRYNGKHSSTGSMGRDYSLKNEIEFIVEGTSGFKVDQQFMYGATKKGIVMKILPHSGSNHYLNLEATVADSEREHKLVFLVDVPAMTSPMRLTGLMRPSGEQGKYAVQLSLSHGDRKAMEINGPCTIILEPQNSNIETALRVKILNQEPFQWQSKIQFTNKEIVLLFDVASSRGSLFLVEWKFESRNIERKHMVFRIDVIGFLKTKLDVFTNTNHVKVNSDLLVVFERPQRIKADVDVKLQDQQANVEVLWDADHDPNKKISGQFLLRDRRKPPYYDIASIVDYRGQRYKIKLGMKSEYETIQIHSDNSIEFTLTNPQQKTLVLEGLLKTDFRGHGLKLDSQLRYKSFEENDYKMSNLIERTPQSDGRNNYEVKSEFMRKLSEHGESALKMAVKSSIDSAMKREVITKVMASVPGKHPGDVALRFVTGRNEFSAEVKSDMASPHEMFLWKTLLHDRGLGLKSLEMKTDFTGVADFLRKVREIIVPQEGSSSIATYRYDERRSLYHSVYENSPDNKHVIWIQTPHRRIHAEGESMPARVQLHLYPDITKGDEKYEMTLLSTTVEGTMFTPDKHQWQGRLRHPDFPRDKTATFELGYEGAGIKGTMEIDILPDVADKLTGTLTSTRLTEDSTRIEAVLSARVLRANPVLTTTIAHSRHMIGFDVLFKKAPSQPVSFKMVGKYDQSTSRNKAVSFEMEKDGQPVMLISAVTRHQNRYQCYGTHIKASAVTSFLGNYNIQADACRPFFIDVSVNREGEQKLYIGKFGYENPDKAEINLSTLDKNTQETHRAFLASLRLISPTNLMLHFDYKSEDAKTILNYLWDKLDMTAASAKSWLQRVKEIIQEAATMKHIQFPSEELTKEWQIIVQEATAIYRDVRDNKVHPTYERIKNFLNNPILSYIAGHYYRACMNMGDIHKSFTEGTYHKILSLMRVFKDVYDPVLKDLRDLAHMMRTAEVPEFIQNIRTKWFDSWLYKKFLSALNTFEENYPTQYRSLEASWYKLRAALMVDLEKLRVKFLSIPPVADFIDWVASDVTEERMVNFIADGIVSRILRETVYPTVTTHPGHIKVNILLHEEVYSLAQVINVKWLHPSLTAQNIILFYDNYIPYEVRRLIQIVNSISLKNPTSYLPPFNGTAMLIGNSEILSFDGVRFRIPRTPCEITLVDTGNTKLSFKHQPPFQNSAVTLVYSNMRVVVTPDFKVSLDGHDVPSIIEKRGLVIRNNPEDIHVTTPLLSIHVVKNHRILEVQISGWTSGNVAGILGTFDGERANDWMMPTGAIANNVQEFVTSWQRDSSCQTPALEPIRIRHNQVVVCHTLLGIRYRCNPIVDPRPFIEMCREMAFPCDAAKAYRYVCSQRGIVEPYPITC